MMYRSAFISIMVFVLSMCLYTCKQTEVNSFTIKYTDLIGKWSISRIEYSGFDSPLDYYNRVDTALRNLGVDYYVFKSDSSYVENYTQSIFYSIDSTDKIRGYEKGFWQIHNLSVPTVNLKRSEPQSAFLIGPYSLTLTSNREFFTVYSYRYILPTNPYALHSYNEKIFYRKIE